MSQFSTTGGHNPGAESVPGEDRGNDLRADLRMLASTARKGDQSTSERTVVGTNELQRLSVGGDGRLFWDDKPVVVRRRLALTAWQKVGAVIIGAAVLTIALSALVRASIAMHDWMCSAKWVTSYCPGAAPPPPPPKPPPLPELPT